MDWEKTELGNEVLQGDGFFISFRADTSFFGSFFSGDDDGEGETAICFDDTYAILNGDFRKEYESIINEGLDACLVFFNANEDKKSEWSSI